MAAFSATDAAFEGFQIIAKRPLAVLSWGALTAILYGGFFATMFVVLGPRMEALRGGVGGEPRPAEALAAVSYLVSAELLFFAGVYILRGVIAASVYRVVLRPDEGAPLNIGLGLAELMQLVVTLAFGVLLFLLFVPITMLTIPVIFGIVAAPPMLQAPFGIALGLADISVIMFFAVRFSLAAPATFAERNIKIFESWTLTRGSFWPLLGAYILAAAVTLVVYALVMIVFVALGAVGFMSSPGLLAAMEHPETMNPALLFGPMQIIVILLGLIVGCLMSGFAYAMFYGPSAHAYRAIVGAAATV